MIYLFAIITSFFAIAGETHSHEPGHAPLELKLNEGKKWPSDEALREGMDKMRAGLTARLDSIHKNKAKRQDYESLASDIDRQVQFIFKNCKLPGDADAQLHVLLARIIAGSAQMKSVGELKERRQGAVQIISALEEYGRYFEHPGWKQIH